jgi:hypothetical protein
MKPRAMLGIDGTEILASVLLEVIPGIQSAIAVGSGAAFLQAGCGNSLVAELTKRSNLILFSAAIPGQGLGHSSNERWQDDWAAEFLARGYYAIDAIRPQIWGLDSVNAAYRQNAILYANLPGIERYPGLLGLRVSSLPSLRVVHPGMWTRRRGPARLRETMAQAIPACFRKAGERWLGVS